MNSNEEISHWTLDIYWAKKMTRVNRLSGASLPALIKWDGADKNGGRVPDGAYLAKLKAVGKHKTLNAEQTFSIDTVPPIVTLSISTPVFDSNFLENGQLTLRPQVEDVSPLDRWLLQVVDADGRTAYVFWSSGPVRDVQWAGTDEATRVLVTQGDYRVILQAWDKAGNESLPAFADLKVNVTPREMLERSIHRIKINEAPMGLIVQLDANSLFIKEKGRLELSDMGNDLLREASIVANAYPDSSIMLDGYARTSKPSQDREKSSIFAWKAYSYLIKTGSVKPSRITVRGRGQKPITDRRAAGLPLLKNSVEVIVEGPGPW